MRIFIDQDTDRVIQAPGVNQPVIEVEYKRSPYATLEVQFTRAGVVQELPNDATGIFEIKETGNYDESPVVQALAWVKTGTGTTTVYTFIFSLVNSALDLLFDVEPAGTDTDIDPTQIAFMGEAQWATGGQIHKSPTLTVLIDNDVVRGGDVGPSTPALMYAIFMPSIKRLTGGTSTDLDFIPTVPLIVGTIVEILIDDGSGRLAWLPQILKSGTTAGPGVTTPLDYNASTNDKRWVTGTAQTGPQGINGGLNYRFKTDVANTDPTAGFFKFDNATLASITNLRISSTDNDTRNLAPFLALWDASTTLANRAWILVQKDSAPTNFAIFAISGARTDNTGWKSFPITYAASGGTISDSDVCRVFFFRSGDMGVPGTPGTPGANGRDGGIKYTYLTDIANTDPTVGKLKFDNATLASITNLRISNTDFDSDAISSLLAQLDASSSTVLATVIIIKDGSPGNMLVFTVTGARTDNTGWKNFPITFVASSGSFANNDNVRVFAFRTGDKGTIGNPGTPGQPGGAITFDYLWDTGTTNADPGSGKARGNNATTASITALYIDVVDNNSNALTAIFDSLDGSTSTVKGHFWFVKRSDVTKWMLFTISARITHTGYREFTIAQVAQSGASPFANGDEILIMHARTGDMGTPGTPGPSGAPQNIQNGNYTFVIGDVGKQVYHSSATAHTYTIPSNASVAFNPGDMIILVNDNSAGNLTIAITADTLRRGDGTAGTGSRTVGPDSVAVLQKITTTSWILTGAFS